MLIQEKKKNMLKFLVVFLLFVGIQTYHTFASSCSGTVLFIPLDERFTTRNAFLNLTTLTPYCVLTPPTEILCQHKTSANITALFSWMEKSLPTADVIIASMEMLLYGGLIASRISNDSTSTIMSRLERLISYSHQYPKVDMYISNVVMRIPSYNGDFEEPWYWANYGSNLFTYSYYLDKFQQQNNTEDYQTAMNAIEFVPSSAVDEFVWRRQRNHNVTMSVLKAMSESSGRDGIQRPVFNYFYTTLDDSAEFGYNIREASEIKSFIANEKNKLNDSCCPVYPGADEVHLVMLARYAVNQVQGEDHSIKFMAIYRDPNNIDAIPSYEGQPMSTTLHQQLSAANGVLVDDGEEYDVILFVNNFSGQQTEASQQPSTGNSATDFQMFDSWISKALSQKPLTTIMGFCDNRYANGGDHYFVEYMFDKLQQQQLRVNAYAGWNTNGNTIGTIVSNVILLHLFHNYENNAMFTSLRLIEDHEYQADFRQFLNSYINQVNDSFDTTSNLTMDLSFYEHFSYKVLASRYQSIAQNYQLPWQLDSVYYPWNRTFEMGFYLKKV